MADLLVEQGKEELNHPIDSCLLISLFDFCVQHLDQRLPKLAFFCLRFIHTVSEGGAESEKAQCHAECMSPWSLCWNSSVCMS